MKIVNCTPHSLRLRDASGVDTVLPKSGVVPRVASTPGAPESVPGAPCAIYGADTLGDVDGLPEPDGESLFVVSGIVGAAMSGKGRTDLLVPGTGPRDGVVRDADGNIYSVTRLKRVAP